MNNPKFKKVLAVIFGLIIIAYVIYQSFSAFSSDIRTETASYGSVWDSVTADAYAFRDEMVLTTSLDGVLQYVVDDGGKIEKGGTIAYVYNSEEEAALKSEINKLDSRIENLEKLSDFNKSYSFSPEDLDKKIDNGVVNLADKMLFNNSFYLQEAKEELLYLLNQKKIVIGETENFDTLLQEIKIQRDALKAMSKGHIGEIESSRSGYFISELDGYETVLTCENALNVTTEDLDKGFLPQSVPEDGAGKVSTGFAWYLAIKVSADDAPKFVKYMNGKVSGKIYINIPEIAAEKIEVSVSAVNQENIDSDAAVVLKCSLMNSSLSLFRHGTIEVELNLHSGVMVDQRAIHFEKLEKTVKDENGNETKIVNENVMGVYIISGAEMRFVQIFSDAEINGYVICRTELNESDILYTDRTIKLYDTVVVEGKNLYDGKIVG